MPKRIVLLIAPPGAGKTTVAPYLSKIFGLDNVSIRDLIDGEIARGGKSGPYLALTRKQDRTPNDVTLMSRILGKC